MGVEVRITYRRRVNPNYLTVTHILLLFRFFIQWIKQRVTVNDESSKIPKGINQPSGLEKSNEIY